MPLSSITLRDDLEVAGDESGIGLEAYVGEDVLQGEKEIPFFIGWRRDCNVESIELALDGFTRLIQLYNVNDACVKSSIEEHKILGSTLKTNGYLGGLLEPGVQQGPFMKASLGIHLHLSDGRDVSTVVERTVFSTTITKVKVPDVLSPFHRSSIEMDIVGLSTVLIEIESEKDSDIELVLPSEIGEAFEELSNDVLGEFEKLRAKYPQYDVFFKRLLAPSDKASLPEMMNELRSSFESMKRDSELMEDLKAALTAAIMFRLLDRSSIFYMLYEYFESRAADRAFLTAPLLVANVPKGESQLSLKISMKNVLGETIGQPVFTKCKVESKEATRIPLKELISVRRRSDCRG